MAMVVVKRHCRKGLSFFFFFFPPHGYFCMHGETQSCTVPFPSLHLFGCDDNVAKEGTKTLLSLLLEKVINLKIAENISQIITKMHIAHYLQRHNATKKKKKRYRSWKKNSARVSLYPISHNSQNY